MKRPKKKREKTLCMSIWFTQEEYDRVIKAAGEVPKSTWARNRLLELAK